MERIDGGAIGVTMVAFQRPDKRYLSHVIAGDTDVGLESPTTTL